MKKIFGTLLAVAMFSIAANAQEKREMKPGNDAMHHGRHQMGKHHNRHMMKDLNFSDAQKKQLKANREEYKMKLQQLKQEPNITLKAFNEKKQALNKEQKEKMQSLLTAEQKTKLAELKVKREQERTARQNQHFEKLKTTLALSNEQAAQWKAQNETVHNNLQAIRENESLSREEKRQQMKAIKDASMAQHKSILTAEQQQKMEEMKKERQQKGKKESSI